MQLTPHSPTVKTGRVYSSRIPHWRSKSVPAVDSSGLPQPLMLTSPNRVKDSQSSPQTEIRVDYASKENHCWIQTGSEDVCLYC